MEWAATAAYRPLYGGEYRYARVQGGRHVDVQLLLFESFGGFWVREGGRRDPLAGYWIWKAANVQLLIEQHQHHPRTTGCCVLVDVSLLLIAVTGWRVEIDR